MPAVVLKAHIDCISYVFTHSSVPAEQSRRESWWSSKIEFWISKTAERRSNTAFCD